MRQLVVGTRGSALALTQTTLVCDALRRAHPGLTLRVERIVTTGDARPNESLGSLGRGVFVTEIEVALRERRIDLAVHSAKDLPSTLAPDVAIAAFLRRADARDVLVSRAGSLRELPPGARVGTSSPRRMCQVRAARPDLDVREVRGNVDTRLRKLADGEFDALLLAAAGLERLSRTGVVTEWFDVGTLIPCVGQGALAVETRADDAPVRALVAALDDASTRRVVCAERGFLAELGAGCLAPAAAHARDMDDGIQITALIGSIDGRHMTLTRHGPREQPEQLGRNIARALLANGAGAFLASAAATLHGARIALTRTVEQSLELSEKLRARHASVLVCPAIAIRPVDDTTALDSALQNAAAASWIVFTSTNAVRAVASRLLDIGRALPRTPRLAAIGTATADALSHLLRPAEFVSQEANGEALAASLPDVEGHVVLLPSGDLAEDTVATRLQERGAQVRRVIAYRTVPGEGIGVLSRAVADGEVDAVVFASPSSVRFASRALGNTTPAARPPLVVCIGPTTAAAARAAGITPDVVGAAQSAAGIIDALERALAGRPAGVAAGTP